MMSGGDLFWVAPLLPLGVFALLSVGLSRRGPLAGGLAIASLAGSSVVSGFGLYAASQGERAVVGFPWLTVGGRTLELALWLDPLSALIATLVSVVGLLVFIYAASYMANDPRRGRFFAELSLFIGSMLMLILAADLITLFIAWELVGLCSYLLIGFWFERPDVPPSATKAFITTRIGDLAMLAGVLLLINHIGVSRIDPVLDSVAGGSLAYPLLLISALLVFTGAASKSAQVPFQGWLPDAMVGPAPVSALLHSATMVAAGVFLTARLYPLFLAAGPALKVVAWVGATTALLGAAAALVQTDLKRLLAYSTMSQLGLMFVGLGAGSMATGVLLLVSQALYKASLFLAAGAVDHSVEGTAFERMGGLAKRMPYTFLVFVIAATALAGLPVTLALPPKDAVLAAAWQSSAELFAAGLLASLLTALYTARALSLVFLGAPSEPAKHAREAPSGFIAPMLSFAALIVSGLLIDATVMGRPLSRLLSAEIPEVSVVTATALITASVGVGAGLWARVIWPRAVVWPVLQRLEPLLRNEFGLVPVYRSLTEATLRFTVIASDFDRRIFDPAAERLAMAFRGLINVAERLDRATFDRIGGEAAQETLRLIKATNRFDRATFDRIGGASAQGTLRLIRAMNRFDVERLDALVRRVAEGLLDVGQRVRRFQTGRIENYLFVIFVWGFVVIAVALLAALR